MRGCAPFVTLGSSGDCDPLRFLRTHLTSSGYPVQVDVGVMTIRVSVFSGVSRSFQIVASFHLQSF